MANRDDIKQGKQVLGSDGGMVGVVDALHGDHIHVQPTAPAPGAAEHTVPLAWVARVDDHVHLDRPAATVRERWGADDRVGTTGEGTIDHRTQRDRKRWIPWTIGIILLLAILYFAMRGFQYGADDTYNNAAETLPSADSAGGTSGNSN
jgi:hypothetical protein